MTSHPLMNRTQAVQYLGISIATFWRLAAAGDPPPHIQLSRRRVGYRQQDLDDWLLSRRVGEAAIGSRASGDTA
jgi:predicted DNA-binding transcriptional regulator AlpA